MLAYLENKKKSLLAKARDKKGFTLVELMIVIVIIGVLVAMAMANFGKSGEDAKVARAKSDARTLAGAAQIYYSDTGKDITGTITQGDSSNKICQTLMGTDDSPSTGEKVGPWLNSCPIPPWASSTYEIIKDGNQIYVKVSKSGKKMFDSTNLAAPSTTTPSGTSGS